MNVSRGLIVAQGILSGFAVGAVVAVVGLGGAVLLMEPTEMDPLPDNVTIVGREGAQTLDAPEQQSGAEAVADAETDVATSDPAREAAQANAQSQDERQDEAPSANDTAQARDTALASSALEGAAQAGDTTENRAQGATSEAPTSEMSDAGDTGSSQSATTRENSEATEDSGTNEASATTERADGVEANSDRAVAAQVPDSPDSTEPSATMAEAKATGPDVAQSIADEEIAALQTPETPDDAPLTQAGTPGEPSPVTTPEDQPVVLANPATEGENASAGAGDTPPEMQGPEMQGPETQRTQTVEATPESDRNADRPEDEIVAGAGDLQPGTPPNEGEDDQLAALSPEAANDPLAPVGLPETSVVTNRLPRIGDPDEPAPAAPAVSLASAKAIDRNAIAFEGARDLPKMSLLLLDTGPARREVGDLSLLPFPLSVAVDASAPDAEEAIKFYRDNGAEVILIVPLPSGATPTDVDVTFQAYGPLLKDVVAVMAEENLGFQALGGGAKQVITNLNEAGLGLVSFTQGLNTAHKAALKDGVPAGQVFRDLDGDGQTPAVIRRFLDNVAFKARNEDGVIALARVRPDSIQALLEWSLGNRAQTVALAPVSATLPR
ncbi:MAG: divergent polysaccharide deacetylase family protein [Maritimibacter sp.]